MRPVPVPDWVSASPWVEGTTVFSAPDGDLTSEQIPPAEGLFYTTKMAGYGDQDFDMVAVILELEPSDIAAIQHGAKHVMLSWHGRRMPVFVVPDILVENVDVRKDPS
jgi:hypothetical protein